MNQRSQYKIWYTEFDKGESREQSNSLAQKVFLFLFWVCTGIYWVEKICSVKFEGSLYRFHKDRCWTQCRLRNRLFTVITELADEWSHKVLLLESNYPTQVNQNHWTDRIALWSSIATSNFVELCCSCCLVITFCLMAWWFYEVTKS